LDNVWTIHTSYKDFSPHSEQFWEYEVKCLENTDALKVQLDSIETKDGGQPIRRYLKFKQDYGAAVFALCVQRNGFPVVPNNDEIDSNNPPSIENISYGLKFWSGVYSLDEFKTTLAGRKVVMLLPQYDYDRYEPGLKFRQHDKLTMYLANAAKNARADGYDTSELIICCTGGEELYKILAGYVLREKGYLLFPEYDFGMVSMFLEMSGVPDMIAVKLGSFQDKLINEGIIANGGWFHEIELMAGTNHQEIDDSIDEAAVDELLILALEIEDTAQEASSGYNQLHDYTATSYFDGGMLVCPKRHYDIEENKNSEFCLITWNYEGKMLPGPRFECHLSSSDPNKKKQLVEICKRLITNNIRKDSSKIHHAFDWG
jgi:hypothetical protein